LSSEATLEGQLNAAEREQILRAVTGLLPRKPICLEVGTYKGGGSTLQILQALAQGEGILFGIEASPKIFDEMKSSLQSREPHLCSRFVPVLGFSQKVIPSLIAEGRLPRVDFAFLDGGNNPKEQIEEFYLLDSRMPEGAILMAHDALLRKGKWLSRVLPVLDHYETQVLRISEEGLLIARKRAPCASLKSRMKVNWLLFLCRLSPLELAAQWTPPGIRSLVFALLPKKIGSWLGDGRRL
jgi:hypothetical protein